MRGAIAVLLLAGALRPAPAAAQTVEQAQQQISAILVEMENNLVDRDAIEMNTKDWSSRYNSIKPRFDDLTQRYAQENAYCTGTFEHDEYVRRKAACDATFSQLDSLRDQLKPEVDNIEEEGKRLQQRDTDRSKAFDAINARLQAALQQLVYACAPLSAAEFAAKCRMPPAPGPRTAPMVGQLNSSIQGH